ncbi:MAG: GNAT family N-acetyltransferase [bacterium]|nr:GNAT family N-acetyltransferase [bacterium]
MSQDDGRSTLEIRRLGARDAEALAFFYNRLSVESRRTFRPLGPEAHVNACDEVVLGNVGLDEIKFDLVAIADGTVVGWAFLWDIHTSKPTFGLAVDDACHGTGLGSRLMDAVMDEARRRGIPWVQLTVVQDNERAWRMYQRRGFAQTGEHVGDDGLSYFKMEARIAGGGAEIGT